MKRILVTGGAGFIGSNLVRELLSSGHQVLTVDSLTYAGNTESLVDVFHHPGHEFLRLDITEESRLKDCVMDFFPDWIFHLAAETHVDRSIKDPMTFVEANVLGTASLLQAALQYWRSMSEVRKEDFRLIHVSTDEVFGSLATENAFTENFPYQPRSPYSASKAASDHLVRAWSNTYGLPAIVTNCSNNYGPYQFPEKLISVAITNALLGRKIPVYGQGLQIRDWIHVSDHCEALMLIAATGKTGETYLIGGGNEWRNIDVVGAICEIIRDMSGICPEIEFVADRAGHDFRYSINTQKIRNELGWTPQRDFVTGLRETFAWYMENRQWWDKLTIQDACMPPFQTLSNES